MSLSRAFAYAGVPSTVMSLWRVPDRSTQLLMEHFHQNLLVGMSKSKALNEARKSYLSGVQSPDQAHPIFWAGFVLNGDPEPIEITTSYKNWQIAGIILLFLFPLFFMIPYLRLRMKSRPGKPQ